MLPTTLTLCRTHGACEWMLNKKGCRDTHWFRFPAGGGGCSSIFPGSSAAAAAAAAAISGQVLSTDGQSLTVV